MLKKKSKIVTYLLSVVGFIVIFSVLLPNVIIQSGVQAKGIGSTLGGIDIDGLKAEEVINKVEDSIDDWFSAPVKVIGGEQTLVITADMLEFDLDTSYENFNALRTPWYLFWEKEKLIQMPLEVTTTESLEQVLGNKIVWDTEATIRAILEQASYLNKTEIEAVLNKEVSANIELAKTVIDLKEDIGDLTEVEVLLNNTMINGEKQFSLVGSLEDAKTNFTQEALNVIASALYNTVLQTNYEIIERHSQTSKPTYLEQGLEATIDKVGFKDLVFINNEDTPSILKAEFANNKLIIAILANEKNYDVKVNVDKSRIVKPKIIYRYSTTMPIGAEKVIETGSNGQVIDVYREINGKGEYKKELVTSEYYPPRHRIIMKSTKQQLPLEDKKNTNTNKETPGNVPETVKPNGQPASDDDDLSKDQQETEEGYYDKAGNYHQK